LSGPKRVGDSILHLLVATLRAAVLQGGTEDAVPGETEIAVAVVAQIDGVVVQVGNAENQGPHALVTAVAVLRKNVQPLTANAVQNARKTVVRKKERAPIRAHEEIVALKVLRMSVLETKALKEVKALKRIFRTTRAQEKEVLLLGKYCF